LTYNLKAEQVKQACITSCILGSLWISICFSRATTSQLFIYFGIRDTTWQHRMA